MELSVKNLDDAYALLQAELQDVKEGLDGLQAVTDQQRVVAQRQAAVLHQFQDRLRLLEEKNEEWEVWETVRQTWEAQSLPSSGASGSASGSGTLGTSVSGTTNDDTATTATNDTNDTRPWTDYSQ